MYMRGNQLVRFVPLLLDGSTILCDGFVLQDLEVHLVVALFDALADVVVCGNTMAVVFGSEGIDKGDISVTVVS